MAAPDPAADFAVINEAIQSGNTEILSFLLTETDSDMTDQNGNTPLMVAASQPSPDCVSCILLAGAQPDLRDRNMNTALMKATVAGCSGCVQMLLDYGANVHLENNCGDAALHIACLHGHLNIVKMMVGAGAMMDDDRNAGEVTDMRNAYHGSMGVVKDAVDSGAYLANWGQNRRRQALISPAIYSFFKRDRVVFPQGIHSSHVITAPVPDIHNTIRHIMAVTSSPQNRLGGLRDTPLICASREGRLDVCRWLIELGARIEARNAYEMTALGVAAANGHSETVRFLLTYGAEVDHANAHGRTALHIAAANGHVEVGKALLEEGANIESVTIQLDTPLLLAAKHDQPDMLEFLLSNGAMANCVDIQDNSPLICAATSDHSGRMVPALLRYQPVVNWANAQGHTALMVSARHGYVQNTGHLLAVKAIDVNMRNLAGRSAMEEAVLERHKIFTVLGLLLDAGAKVNDAVHYAIIHRNYYAIQTLLQLGAIPTLSSLPLTGMKGIIVPQIDRKLSPLAVSLCIGDIAIAKFLTCNFFLHASDQNSLAQDAGIRHFLAVNDKGTSLEFLEQVFSQPWSLLTQSLFVVSAQLGFDQTRTERVKQLDLPLNLMDKLLFKDATVRLSVSAWPDISLEHLHGHVCRDSTHQEVTATSESV